MFYILCLFYVFYINLLNTKLIFLIVYLLLENKVVSFCEETTMLIRDEHGESCEQKSKIVIPLTQNAERKS